MKRPGPARAWLTALALLAVAPAALSAQGSAVYTQSACMNGRNGAGIAAPCNDGSAVYYNPAALARQNGAVSFGATVIDQSGTFVYDSTAREIERAPRSVAVPHGWATWRPMERLGVGLGVWAPYGLSIDWPVCPLDQGRCGTGFEGRFVGYDQSLRALYFQPTVAWDLIPGRLAIGGGVDVIRASVEIRRRLDLSEQSVAGIPFSSLGIAYGTDFADATIDGNAWGVTGHVGLLFNLTSGISIGARYMHSANLEFEGDATFRQVSTSLTLGPLPPLVPIAVPLDQFLSGSGLFGEEGTLADQSFTAGLTLPAQAVVGIAIQLDPTLRIMADAQWTQWSAWDVVDVDFESADDEALILDYQDAITLRVGADYALTDRVTVHGGFTHAEPAAKDASVSPFLPDSERAFYSGGMGFRASERLSLDFFAMSVRAADRRGRVRNRDSLTQTADELNEGLYTATGQLFGASVTYHLGGPR